MLMSDDSWAIFLSRTTSMVLVIGIVLALLSPAMRPYFRRLTARRLSTRALAAKVEAATETEGRRP
jgi:TctA family transporter